jgi:GNAT superfamily N-acetyltransferase
LILTELREATEADWPELQSFFSEIYRPNHPLQNFSFWKWQYGDANHGRSFIIVSDGKVSGHLGAYFCDHVAWIMNLYLKENLRGMGFLAKLHNAARAYYPLASANINAPGLSMYQKMGYIRYHDLLRYTLIRPDLAVDQAVAPMQFSDQAKMPSDRWYWKQPGLISGSTPQGDTFVRQDNHGGLRVVEVANIKELAKYAWGNGARWIDYITTWNDPLAPKLESAGWLRGDSVPFRLDPLIPGSKSDIALISEEPLPKSLIVRRYHSDHGRVPSISAEGTK